jgi:sigma-B regulation protein RsbU (phosphoserine phosphatase)
MEPKFFERIRSSLLERRNNLNNWLNATPSRGKQALLGPATEQAVHAHLHTIDTALEKTASKTFGRCEVCDDFIEADLLEVDYTTCVCIDHLSTEEIRHLEYELELAQRVQKTLLPQQVPEISSLDIAAFSRPAQIIGGDYFDFFRYQHGAHGLAIADVAGHGVSASLHMASVQTLLRTLVPSSTSPLEVMRQVHGLYTHNIHFTTFVTLFIGALDTASHTLTYCNAGHNPPLVLRKRDGQEDSMFWLGPTGPAIGLVEEIEFREETTKLQPGDILLLYTDGVTEAFNAQNEQFGQERLATIVGQGTSLPAGELIRVIRQELQEFTDGRPLADDTTIVVYKTADGQAR